jgi:secreted PhoX family phosphatase
LKTGRRYFLGIAGAVSLGFVGLYRYFGSASFKKTGLYQKLKGYGQLQSLPTRVIDLPEEFSCNVISTTGQEMNDGFLVPAKHDGMASFPGPEGKTIVIRNHEMSPDIAGGGGPFGLENELFGRLSPGEAYDNGKGAVRCKGGTTTLVYDTKTQRLESHFLSLAGTLRNCAGGPTPWNSWITCEETTDRAGEWLEKDHGYNFEVPASADQVRAKPIALTEMGRFRHEAVAVDPQSGSVFQTEDHGDGLIYRFIPNKRGELASGGKLQALMIRGAKGSDTRNWGEEPAFPVGKQVEVDWIDMDDVESPKDDLRFRGFEMGAATFARGEGMWYGRGAVYFACTNGGIEQHGQIWKYIPSALEGTEGENEKPGILELFLEPNDSREATFPNTFSQLLTTGAGRNIGVNRMHSE